MNESQISKAYAKAITQIAESENVNLTSELTTFSEMIASSNNLESLLHLDVFTAEERLSVLDEIFKKNSYSNLVKNFIKFLIQEKRFNLFSMIFKEVIIKEDFKMGFITGVIEGSDEEPNLELLDQIKEYIEKSIGLKTKVTYKHNNEITAGYKATVGDLQIDATLENQLKKFKEETLYN